MSAENAGAGGGDLKASSQASPPTTGVAKRPGFHTFSASGTAFSIDEFYAPRMVLGSGAYGVVISAIDKRDGKKRAIKKISNAFKDIVDTKRLLREIKLLRHFKHENISSLVDMIEPESVETFNDIYIVLDYMETDLHKIIYSKNALTDEHIQYFIYQILCGLKYIHSAEVLHRDLKPSNVLLNSDCELQICDFGLARGVHPSGAEEETTLTEYVVTRWYRAPEVMCSCNDYSYPVDVWAVGCILGELLGRQPLFPGEDYIAQLNLLIQALGTPTPEDMEFVSNENAVRYIEGLPKHKKKSWAQMFPKANPQALDLMDRMLAFNPAKRLTVDEALAHPYLKELVDDLDAHKVECKEPFDFSFERSKMTKETLKDMVLDEIRCFRPDAPVFKRPPPAPIAGGGVFNSV